MASNLKGRGSPATSAEISLIHLKNCLVNLPSSLSSLLVNINALAQNVIIELNYRLPPPQGQNQTNGTPTQRSIFVGWTGMQSKRKLAPIVGRDGINGARGSGREQEVQIVEIDATFARTLGILDGQKITASIHVDPPVSHTINMEPLTPEDWEIIELHATFLELNFINQIRALPNPSFTSSNGPSLPPHPLTLHLSPTSTANIIITSLLPATPSNVAFTKLAPDAEVIVAPKTRSKPSRTSGENMSVSSRKSVGGGSVSSTVARKSGRIEEARPAMFFRGIDRAVCGEWFEEEKDLDDGGLKVWVDEDLLLSKTLKGITWVCVTVIKPESLQEPIDPQRQQQENENNAVAGKAAPKVVARLMAWDDPPDESHVALSTSLCASMGCENMVGGLVMLEPAPPQASKPTFPPSSKTGIPHIKIFPYSSSTGKASESLKFGGESKAEREEAAKLITKMYTKNGSNNGILEGPLTDGLVLGKPSGSDYPSSWEGGMLRLEQAQPDPGKIRCNWFLGSERKFNLEVQAAIPRPLALVTQTIDGIGAQAPVLVGIDNLLEQLESRLTSISSVLLTGALGAGKTSVAHLLAHRLRQKHMFHTTYLSCRKLVTDEARISTIKETLNRVFMGALWGARNGGQSIVILDDLDKLCPVETELEVGNDNLRSKLLSEAMVTIAREYLVRNCGVVLLATAQAKESVHKVIIGCHVVREIVPLKAPNKEGRRRVVEMVARQNAISEIIKKPVVSGSRPSTANNSERDNDGDWMDGPSMESPRKVEGDGYIIDQDLDFLDLAGKSDGYMPGDLVLLVARAKSEAMIRTVSSSLKNDDSGSIRLTREDFDSALKGFTPASLRNVTLQTSTTTFDSIGGLHEIRRILLETLQYPITYAPLFAQCPLRLRSGLLLYGFPGCGKTLLASAVAGECGLNFISVKGPEILNKYIGASEKSVRDLFERAEAARPCVLFFDEFDSIAPKRGHDSTGVTDRVVNQLLTQMDGAEGLSGVYVLAATSRPDLIDPALLRPGRLDKSLLCDLPTVDDRFDILKALGKKLKLSEEVRDGPQGGFLEIARRTEGYSGADLQALISNAQLEAIHDVLGDHEEKEAGEKRNGAKTNGASGASQNFIQFRYGEDEEQAEAETRAKAGNNRSKQLTERAAITAKLEEIKKAKKREKLRAKGIDVSNDERGEQKEVKGQQEVTILWKHLVKGLEETRASISVDERRRLQGIYREFLVGRTGDMPNGQGGTEVGGRSSLM
ncbi:putative Peroxisome biosynthesis protein PAS1 [Sclerotinia borealis F-4128]|uniref:Peroxisomal ATPase PEX1 n=1 Tax=Sclerotinia borealis (strain F-4128) TaxID=1432307 RepID=W9CHS3_SCLBF|nr:putative Peroxisome biosynthesis protein PAS1 [Sclerotinia borealis F-4128]